LIPEIALVLARADNGVIGRGGALPWRLSRDMKRFRAVTIGKPVIMGRRTHLSIGRPLPGRDNIVITRNPAFSAPGCHVVHDFETAIDTAGRLAERSGAREVCVIGGAEIYLLALAGAGRVHLTEVHFAAEGDVRLAPFAAEDWREVARERFEPEGDDTAAFSFVELERRAGSRP